jgi:hypothetical protein
MSHIALETWAEAGYTDPYDLDGGIEAWEAAGARSCSSTASDDPPAPALRAWSARPSMM